MCIQAVGLSSRTCVMFVNGQALKSQGSRRAALRRRCCAATKHVILHTLAEHIHTASPLGRITLTAIHIPRRTRPQVGDDVGDIRETTNNIDARVGQMDHTMQLMASGVARANEGIYLLCAAVADVTRRVGMDNSKLRSYVQAAPPPPELADSSPGLRQLLEGGENVTVQGSTVITQLEDSPSGSVAVSGSGGAGANGVLSSSSSMPPAVRAELDDFGVMYSRREVAGPPSMNGRGIMGSVGSMWSNSKPRGLSS